MTNRLDQRFFQRPARTVAQALLGTYLVHRVDGVRVAGMIVETEAYCDSVEPDLACHGAKNKGRPTKRTQLMFGEAGYVYMYFNYGLHWLFNVVTGETGEANAVLVRALQPTEGLDFMAKNRPNMTPSNYTNGPAKLTKALSISDAQRGASLFDPNSPLFIEPANASVAISIGPRVGLGKTPEPWFSIPWRYWITNNDFVSAYR